jgi:hypothetical protein|nr:MAG TPA: hypothetical protein [Caudoviricetes sp.]
MSVNVLDYIMRTKGVGNPLNDVSLKEAISNALVKHEIKTLQEKILAQINHESLYKRLNYDI